MGIVHSEHRTHLLPILMRILYGKFNSTETTHTSSRDTKSNKRSLIVQFLSSCSERELDYFFRLLFDCMKVFDKEKNENKRNQLNESENEQQDDVAMLHLMLNNPAGIYNLKRAIPLRKMFGILQSLEILMKKLARQLVHFAHHILVMLCFMSKYTTRINELLLSEVGEQHRYLPLLKLIRQQTIHRFRQVIYEYFSFLNYLLICIY
jgi:hypothetical protein